jgi:hypothetical protein
LGPATATSLRFGKESLFFAIAFFAIAFFAIAFFAIAFFAIVPGCH